jgi:hypothetical protein
MKTSMQDMIEWIEQRFNNPQETEVFKKATELIEKEKEQIRRDFKNGCKSQPFMDLEYYNQFYNQNK